MSQPVMPLKCAFPEIQFLGGGADVIARELAVDVLRDELTTEGIDHLTGLLNAHAFRRELERAATRHAVTGGFALLLISVDSYQTGNAIFGRGNGDLILTEMADRLRHAVGSRGQAGRVGADEFAVLFDSGNGPGGPALAEELLQSVSGPYLVEAEEVMMSASAGVSYYPEHGRGAEDICRAAEMALSHAKQQGGATVVCFDEQIGRAARRRAVLERTLRKALARGEFELEFQPRVHLASMRVVAMEALLRWNHPELGRISPLDFIPIAERKGLIGEIGRWVLHTACAFASELAVQTASPIRVSVNISARQLDIIQILDDITSALSAASLPACLLELELTESLPVEDLERCADILRSVKALGVSLSVDDFGTGYSSLAYLQLFPVDAIKLDKTFVDRDSRGIGNLKLVKALVNLAHALDLEVVAEGVERADILRYLHASGCNEIQGYLVSRPLNAAGFKDFLASYVPCLDSVARGQISRATAAEAGPSA